MTAAKAEEVATVRDQLVGMHEERERLDARIDLLERARNDAEAAAKAAAGTGGTLEAELHSALQARQAAEAERDQLKTEQLMLISDAEEARPLWPPLAGGRFLSTKRRLIADPARPIASEAAYASGEG